MKNKNRKYNILIIENNIKSEEEKLDILESNCKKIKIEDAENIINSEIFDFIYLYEQEQRVMERFKDYRLLPKAFEKFVINNDVNNTYIHCSTILDIISENIEIMEIEERHQKNILEIILERILYSQKSNVNLEKILIEIQPIFEKDNIKAEIEKIVYKNYAKSVNQIITFRKNKELIIRKFFNKLIHNIQNDIQEMKGFEDNAKIERIEVH